MRETKYRAWDKTTNSMIKDYAHIGQYGELYVSKFNNSAYSSEGCPNLILLQYIGLKDKKGKEIYEDDIVQELTAANGRILISRWITTVTDIWVAHRLIEIDKMNEPMKYVEIIGNIYENPELRSKHDGNYKGR